MSRWTTPFWCACWMAWQTLMSRSGRWRGRQIVFVAVAGDGNSANQLHHEVRAAGLSGAGIQHFDNVRMVQHRQRLPLGFKAGHDPLRVHAQLDDLERDAAADRFLLLGHENHAETAFADLLEEFVAANARAGAFG